MSTPRQTVLRIGAAGLAISTLAFSSGSTHRTLPAFDQMAENHRVQRHIDSVLTELAAGDAHAFTVVARARRAGAIARLAAYRNEAAFPHNYDIPGYAPTFVDPETRALCAVADLLHTTGRDDIVRRVVATDNHAYVNDLKTDTALVTWLADNGLTVAEAARIQVIYVGPPPTEQAASTKRRINAIPLAGVSVGATAWNLFGNDNHRTLGNVLGLATGVAAVALGGKNMTSSAMSGSDLGIIGVGALTSGFAVHGFVSELRHTESAKPSRVAVAPTVTLPTAGNAAQVGVTGQIRF